MSQGDNSSVYEETGPASSSDDDANVSGDLSDLLTPQAAAAMETHIDSYIDDLFELANRARKQAGADMISQQHVTNAAEFLGQGRRVGKVRHVGAWGGIVAGVGLGNWLSMLNSAEYSGIGVSVTLLLSLGGVGALAVHFARD